MDDSREAIREAGQQERERARKNRRACDSRAAAWHNVLLVLAQRLGYTLVVRKPSKLRPRKTLPRVPCVRVVENGTVHYDMTQSVCDFNARDGGATTVRKRKEFLISEKNVAFNVLLGLVEGRLKALDPAWGVVTIGQPLRRVAPQRAQKRRLESLTAYGMTFTNENVVDYGWRVFWYFCDVYKCETKDRDLPMAEFPFETLRKKDTAPVGLAK